MAALNGMDFGALRVAFTSGATSGATFAVAGVASDDKPAFGIVCAGGSTHPVKSVINPADLVFGAGSVKTSAVDTDADTVLVVWYDKSAG